HGADRPIIAPARVVESASGRRSLVDASDAVCRRTAVRPGPGLRIRWRVLLLPNVGEIVRDRPRLAAVGRGLADLAHEVRAVVRERHVHLAGTAELVGLVIERAVRLELADVVSDPSGRVDPVLLPLAGRA